MARIYDKSSELLDGIKHDMLWLLITIYAYQTRSKLQGFGQRAREDLAVEGVLLESAVRDIISRLSALDDDGRGNRSFQTLFSAMKREGLVASRTADLDKKVRAFRRSVNDLKLSHRNSYIAHVGVDADVTPRVFDGPVPFHDVASAAVNLLDDINGQPIPYAFRTGSDLTIDLRRALSA